MGLLSILLIYKATSSSVARSAVNNVSQVTCIKYVSFRAGNGTEKVKNLPSLVTAFKIRASSIGLVLDALF